MRKTSLAVMTTAAMLAVPAGASAATFFDQGGASGLDISYQAGDGVANAITVSGSPTGVTISDPAEEITTDDDPSCVRSDDDHTVTCTPSPGTTITRLSVNAGDEDDTVTSTLTGFSGTAVALSAPAILLDGGDGDDTLTGGPAGEGFSPGTGADTVLAGGGDDMVETGGDDIADRLEGGAGNDTFLAGLSSDTIDGGADQDTLLSFGLSPLLMRGASRGAGMTIHLDGATPTTGNGYPGQDLTLSNLETAYGGPGDDTLTGSSAAETFVGLGGADTIDAGGGSDLVYGGLGPDIYSLILGSGLPPFGTTTTDGANTITTKDDTLDRVDCGTGAGSTIVADDVDQLSHCPAVGAGTTLSPVTAPQPTTVVQTVAAPAGAPLPAPADTTKVVVSGFKAAKKVKAATLRRTGRYSARFTTSEAALGTFELIAGLRGNARIAAAADLQLASKPFLARAGTAQTLKVTIPRSLRKLLRKGRRFDVVVTLIDAGGNRTVKRQRVKLG